MKGQREGGREEKAKAKEKEKEREGEKERDSKKELKRCCTRMYREQYGGSHESRSIT